MIFFFGRFINPILFFLKFIDSFIRRLAGVVRSTPNQRLEEKQDEFLDELAQQRKQGVVDRKQQEMIEGVLELTGTIANEIMTPRTNIVGIEAGSDLNIVVEIITSAGHTRLPVYEDSIDNIIGFIYAKDLLREIGKTSEQFRLRDRLRPAYFVPETKPLKLLLHEFQSRKLHVAVVLDEYGGTAGIVTLEDILEELVGEIADEYEISAPGLIKKIAPDTIEVNARTYVNKPNDEFDLGLPEAEDYDTVGGFVLSHLGYIPKTGDNFDYQNLQLPYEPQNELTCSLML